jgi:hypothetical protein
MKSRKINFSHAPQAVVVHEDDQGNIKSFTSSWRMADPENQKRDLKVFASMPENSSKKIGEFLYIKKDGKVLSIHGGGQYNWIVDYSDYQEEN